MHIVYTRSSNIYDDSRATKEIMAFLRKGYTVSVLGWNRNRDAEIQCDKVFSGYKGKIQFSFFTGNQGKTKIEKIVCRYRWWSWLQKKLKNEVNVDVIHSCDFDTGCVVRRFAKKNRVRYIYDIFDYYTDAHPVPHVIRGYIEKQEISVINEADACIICTEERREQIKEATPKQLIVVHNSPDVQDLTTEEEVYDYAYCGSMYDGRLIGEILNSYNTNSQYKFIFAGYGKYTEIAEELMREYLNFTFVGAIPYSEVLEIEKKSKIISAIYNPQNRNHRLCAPNKFYEALALGKPVIVIKGTGIDKIVEQNNVGIVIDFDANEFFNAVKYLTENRNQREIMGANGRDLYLKEYRWSIMEERLQKLYSQLL